MIHSTVKLSQMDALMIEALRQRGYSNEQIMDAAKQRSFPVDDSMFAFKFDELSDLYTQDQSLFEQAVSNGYQMKFNTIRGIRSWIQIVYEQDPQLVFDEGEEAVYATLTKQQAEQLGTVLSFGWMLEPSEHPNSNVVIKPNLKWIKG